MTSEMNIDACNFCTSMIKLNISLLANPDKADYIERKNVLIDNIRSKYSDLLSMNDNEIQKYLFSVYVGKIDNADAIGEAGSLACGDSLKIYLKIKDNIVTDAKFQTFGCGSAVASSSILTEMIIGKTVIMF